MSIAMRFFGSQHQVAVHQPHYSGRVLIAAFITVALSYCPLANAYKVEPIITTLAPKGAAAKKSIDIINDSDEPMAVEVSIAGRVISVDGKESIVESDEIEKSFGVYPAQAVIKPNSTRTVVVQYRGNPDLKKEEAYRIIVNQVKIDFEKPRSKMAKGGMDFLVQYRGSLYVKPHGTTPNLQLKSISREKVSGKDALAIEVTNNGTAHDVIYAPQLKRGEEVVLGPDELAPMSEANLLASNSRKFLISWPKGKTLEQLQNTQFTY